MDPRQEFHWLSGKIFKNPSPKLKLPLSPGKSPIQQYKTWLRFLDLVGQFAPSICKRDQGQPFCVTVVDELLAFRQAMFKADFIVWEPPMWASATNGSEVFAGKPIDLLPYEKFFCQVWSLDAGIYVEDPKAKEVLGLDKGDFELRYIIVWATAENPSFIDPFFSKESQESCPGGLWCGMVFDERLSNKEDIDDFVSRWTDYQNNRCDPPSDMLPRVRFFHPLVADQEIHFPYHVIVAMVKFMDLKIVSVESSKLPRPDRRRLKKAKIKEPSIRIVKLRKVSCPSAGSGQSGREYHHTWMVQGHYREQWYARSKSNKIIYIEPYMKGPEGKPFLPPKKTIFQVVR